MSKKVHECNKSKSGECDAQKKIMSQYDYEFYMRKQMQIDQYKIRYADTVLNTLELLDLIKTLEADKEHLSLQLREKYGITSQSFSVDNTSFEITEGEG